MITHDPLLKFLSLLEICLDQNGHIFYDEQDNKFQLHKKGSIVADTKIKKLQLHKIINSLENLNIPLTSQNIYHMACLAPLINKLADKADAKHFKGSITKSFFKFFNILFNGFQGKGFQTTSKRARRIANYFLLKAETTSIPPISSFKFANFPLSCSTPFRIIKDLASNHLVEFLKKTVSINPTKNQEGIALTTSCINTAYAVALVFLGSQKTKKMVKQLIDNSHNYPFPVKLPKTLKTTYWHLKVSGLFDGQVNCKINQDLSFDSLTQEEQEKKRIAYSRECTYSFCRYVENEKEKITHTDPFSYIDDLKQKILESGYDFNTSVMKSLRKELEENDKKINCTTSFMYAIGIELAEGWEHIFILEQFLNANKEIRFRIYQSWISQTTLANDLNKWTFNDSREDSWDKAQMNQFLNDFEKFSCKTKLSEFDSGLTCFGYETEIQTSLKFDGDTLSGRCLKYFSAEFNPEKCIENTVAFYTSI